MSGRYTKVPEQRGEIVRMRIGLSGRGRGTPIAAHVIADNQKVTRQRGGLRLSHPQVQTEPMQKYDWRTGSSGFTVKLSAVNFVKPSGHCPTQNLESGHDSNAHSSAEASRW
jgi:hypothetical protein